MGKLHRVSPLFAVLLVIGLLINGCGSANVSSPSNVKPESKEPYKIGFLSTLSGPVGFLGSDVRDTAQMEVDRINAAGGIDGHPIELIVEDDGMDPGKAVAGFTKLVRQDKVLAVTGTVTGLVEPPLRLVAEREQVPYVMLAMTLPEMRARNDKYTFADGPNEFIAVGGWLDLLKEKGYTRVAAIGATDSLSPVVLGEMKKQAPAKGITLDILPDLVDVNAVDVTPQVAKLKEFVEKNKSQAVLSMLWPPNLPALLKTMKQMGINQPVIPYLSSADNSLLNMGGDELNGLVMPGLKVLAGASLPDNDPQKGVIVDFSKRYTAKTGRVAGAMSAYSYDAINIIANALKVAGADKAKLRDAIENTKNYVGATGVFNYSASDHEGMTKECLAIYQIKDKKFVFLRNVNN